MAVAAAAGAGRARSLAAILSSVFAVGIGLGMTAPLIAIRLQAEGHGGVAVGFVQAGYALAILSLGPFLPGIIARLGTVGALVAGLVIAAGAVLAFPFAPGIAAGFLFRAVMGFGTMLDWVVSETWVNRLATHGSRGRIVSLYAVVWSGGLAVGPVLLTVTGTEGLLPFAVCAGLLLAACLPVLAAAGLAPAVETERPMALAATLVRAPLAMIAVAVCGLIEGTMFALLPVYGVGAGLPVGRAVLLASTFAVGAVALQPGIGWLADRFDRAALLALAAGLSLASALLLPLLAGRSPLQWPVLFLWGGAAGGLYTLSLVLLGTRFTSAELPSANTTLVMAYTAGMVVGPITGGLGMELWAPHGMPVWLALVAGLLLALVLARRGRWSPAVSPP